MLWGPWLPLHLTYKSRHPLIRVFGFVVALFWVLPAFAVVCLPVLALIVWDLADAAWAGDY